MKTFCGQKRCFTLVEVVAVLVIIGLISTLAVSNFRPESAASELERSAAEFETFCARVRFQAMESGSDRIVAFDEAERVFEIALPDTVENYEDLQLDLPKLRWKLPERMTIDDASLEPSQRRDGLLEMFRFFPDGGASGIRKISFSTEKLQAKIEISPLTGLLRSEICGVDE